MVPAVHLLVLFTTITVLLRTVPCFIVIRTLGEKRVTSKMYLKYLRFTVT